MRVGWALFGSKALHLLTTLHACIRECNVST
jgi:hypothetical protein